MTQDINGICNIELQSERPFESRRARSLNGKYGPILDDFMEEALRIEKAAAEMDIPLRIIGCLAFRIKSPEYSDLHIKMGREVTDIDYI
ncbi:MAG: hypothetical protein ACXABV_18410, partial [Candidatus Thorarchaeota archaeon]